MDGNADGDNEDNGYTYTYSYSDPSSSDSTSSGWDNITTVAIIKEIEAPLVSISDATKDKYVVLQNNAAQNVDNLSCDEIVCENGVKVSINRLDGGGVQVTSRVTGYIHHMETKIPVKVIGISLIPIENAANSMQFYDNADNNGIAFDLQPLTLQDFYSNVINTPVNDKFPTTQDTLQRIGTITLESNTRHKIQKEYFSINDSKITAKSNNSNCEDYDFINELIALAGTNGLGRRLSSALIRNEIIGYKIVANSNKTNNATVDNFSNRIFLVNTTSVGANILIPSLLDSYPSIKSQVTKESVAFQVEGASGERDLMSILYLH